MKKNKKRQKNRRKSCIAALLSGTLALTTCLSGSQVKTQAAESTDTLLQNPTVVMNECDTVYFGSYWQEDTNNDGVADQNDEKRPIRWRILSKDGNDAYVIADQVLDAKPYNEEDVDVTWGTCTLRAWLNGEFYNNAFTSQERDAVIEQSLVSEGNEEYGTEDGKDTMDKVYLPSIADMKNADYGFQSDDNFYDQTRIGTATAYAKSQGAYVNGDLGRWWWLRSLSDNPYYVSGVSIYGNVDHYYEKYATEGGVRPALHLNLSSPLVTTAGKQEISVKSVSWDTVELGNFEGKPITWRVLEVSDGNAYLLADRILIKKPYNDECDENENITWKDSTLREWLNGEFYDQSFTDVEKDGIVAYTYENADNAEYGTEGGEDTQERITLLSQSDVVRKEYGFPIYYWCEHSARIACDEKGVDEDGFDSWWWLRSPGNDAAHVSLVDGREVVHTDGYDINDVSGGVRPALHISLSESLLRTGSVTADEIGRRYSGEQDEITTETATMEKSEGSTTTEEVESVTTEKETVDSDNRPVETNKNNMVYFGSYWQEDTNGDGVADQNDDKTPIQWRILSQDGNDAYVISERVLDAKLYNEQYTPITWETCTLRKWLNEEFYSIAFTADEQAAVIEQTMANGSVLNGKDGGNDTTDKVYLPSELDMINAQYGFETDRRIADPARVGKATAYAKEQGVFADEDMRSGWWLREPGLAPQFAAIVNRAGLMIPYFLDDGEPADPGYEVSNTEVGIRPVMHISLALPSDQQTGTATTEIGTMAITTEQMRQSTEQTTTEKSKPAQMATEVMKPVVETTETAKTDATTEAAEIVTAPAKPSLKSVTNKASKKLIAKWKKVSGAEGYEISIATKKNFKSGKKVKLTKKATYTFTKLKKGKTYYVRVRAYRTSDGEKLYGTYSTVKKLKIKK